MVDIDVVVSKLLGGDLGVVLAPGDVRPFARVVCRTYYEQHKVDHFFRRLDGLDVICAVDFDPCKFMVVLEEEGLFYVVDGEGVISPDVASMRFLCNDLPGEFSAGVSEGGGFVKSVFRGPDGCEVMVVDNRLDGVDRVVRFYRDGVLDEVATERWVRAYRGSLNFPVGNE